MNIDKLAARIEATGETLAYAPADTGAHHRSSHLSAILRRRHNTGPVKRRAPCACPPVDVIFPVITGKTAGTAFSEAARRAVFKMTGREGC